MNDREKAVSLSFTQSGVHDTYLRVRMKCADMLTLSTLPLILKVSNWPRNRAREARGASDVRGLTALARDREKRAQGAFQDAPCRA